MTILTHAIVIKSLNGTVVLEGTAMPEQVISILFANTCTPRTALNEMVYGLPLNHERDFDCLGANTITVRRFAQTAAELSAETFPTNQETADEHA